MKSFPRAPPNAMRTIRTSSAYDMHDQIRGTFRLKLNAQKKSFPCLKKNDSAFLSEPIVVDVVHSTAVMADFF